MHFPGARNSPGLFARPDGVVSRFHSRVKYFANIRFARTTLRLPFHSRGWFNLASADGRRKRSCRTCFPPSFSLSLSPPFSPLFMRLPFIGRPHPVRYVIKCVTWRILLTISGTWVVELFTATFDSLQDPRGIKSWLILRSEDQGGGTMRSALQPSGCPFAVISFNRRTLYSACRV